MGEDVIGGRCPSWQAMVSVKNFHRSARARPPPADTPDESSVVTTSQVTPSIQDFAVSLVLAALEQRVALRYTMPPMTSQETASYITHHLKLAGRADALFSDDATSLIHTTARGYPRAVNNLALQALVATYAAGKAIVDENAARAAVTEVTDT
jgi:hypothetical protein